MIEPGQAENIVRDCIYEVGDRDEEYKAYKPLGKFRIKTDYVIDSFKEEILKDKQNGVRRYNHSLAAAELDSIGEDTLAGDVEDVIVQKAQPITGKALPARNGQIKTVQTMTPIFGAFLLGIFIGSLLEKSREKRGRLQ